MAGGLRFARVLVAVALLGGPPAAVAAQPIRASDIMGLTDVSDPQLSPDGKRVAYVVTPTLSTQRPARSAIWIAPVDRRAPPRRLTTGTQIENTPRWSADGRDITFLSNQVDPGATGIASKQVWTASLFGEPARRLTASVTEVRNFSRSSDGKALAYVAGDPKTEQQKADAAAKRDQMTIDDPGDLGRLWLLDAEGGQARRIAIEGRNIADARWSPDGKRLAARVSDSTGLNDYFYHSDVVIIDAATGAARTVFREASGPGEWSPDGKRLAFAQLREQYIGLRAWIIDVDGDHRLRIGEDHPGYLNHLEWAADGRSLLAQSFENTRTKLVRIDATDGRIKTLLAFDGRLTGFSAEGGRVAMAGDTPTRPEDVWLWKPGQVAAEPLTDLNPQVREWTLGQVREVSWTSSKDGRRVYGTLVTPPGYVGGAPIKTVIQGHGGPEGFWWSGWLGSWHEWAQMLATHGYAVLLPNPRGSDGQDIGFTRGPINDWGGGDFQDLLDGLDMLIAQKITDPTRVGIGGWSYGGFLSAWAVTHSDRFRTAIVGAAPVDVSTMLLTTDTPDFVAGFFAGAPENLARMDASSPVRFVDRVKVPVLVLHGEQDRRVPVTLGLSFYRGLRLLEKDATMVSYPREPHWTYEPAHQTDIQERVLAWFDAHL
jgi:dipeptidyl aminopeptidase/acylaminoacyl peptidase